MSELQVDVDGRTLTISNLDKVLYPRTGTTRGEVLNYYAQVSPVLLPHLQDRAVTRIRWPHGVEKGSFFEKNAPAGTPSRRTRSRATVRSGVSAAPTVAAGDEAAVGPGARTTVASRVEARIGRIGFT